MKNGLTAEQRRLKNNYNGKKAWLKWGPYLSERQWGTVREDYSHDGSAWNYLTHDMARSQAYRWGEDGIAGISDNRQRICFSLALWNGQDPILKERLFGLVPDEGNHGEDVKELYYYLDNTPTHSYMKYLYKYPQQAFPYNELIEVNRRRTKQEEEFEIIDTGVFNDSRYFDVFIEYAKNDEEDICIRIDVKNRYSQEASITILPTLWARNLWSFGLSKRKPIIEWGGPTDNDFEKVHIQDPLLKEYTLYFQRPEQLLFTENETNKHRLYGIDNETPFTKDIFNDAITTNHFEIFTDKTNGTKFAPLYRKIIAPQGSGLIKLRLTKKEIKDPLGENFDTIFSQRIKEADEFYGQLIVTEDEDLKNVERQAYAGMLWNKQFYYIDIPSWLNGDPGQPEPPQQRKYGRNADWLTLNNEDIISMPDKWEYPWYAAWDTSFHCISLASLDTQFAKDQLILFLREWYMNPYGQLPAYEWAFSDVNPPVHAWACMQVYKIDKEINGTGDTEFLERVFQKLLINFTWWVNRKDQFNNNVFEGGFLGLDNIGVFDRNNVPGGGYLQQADGTAWMGMYCLDMLEIALELALSKKVYEDLATKFFEHFTYIAASLNQIREGVKGAWDEEESFFYDVLRMPDGNYIPVKVRSLVGLTSLFAVLVINRGECTKLTNFYRRLKWFVQYQQKNDQYTVIEDVDDKEKILLSLVPHNKLEKVLNALLDENEFLSPGGIRSLSKVHKTPYRINIEGQEFGLHYQPGDADSGLFGGNSNWRGPVWMPMNYLMIIALEKFYQYFGEELKVALPSHSGEQANLKVVAENIRNRLIGLFARDGNGERPVNGKNAILNHDEYFRDLVLFYEYFHGDNGRGIGASHQTGWTGAIAEIIRCKYQSIGDTKEEH